MGQNVTIRAHWKSADGVDETRVDVGAWLRHLALERYAAAFLENGIDGEILPHLTADDLKDLGVTLVGDRRKLLEAIATLRAAAPVIALEAPPQQPKVPQAVATVTVERAREAGPVQQAGERRHLTVMFCDLVGSTQIAARLDAEEWRDIVAAYHALVLKAVTRFGGYVAKNLGDGALVYFGYPQAQENDAERALRAGLALIEAMTAQGAASLRAAPELAVRVGIHAGAVVIGEDGEVYGDVPNIAARVQAAAEPGTVLISSDVHRLVSGLFVVADRGLQALKGVPEPLALLEVTRASGGRRRAAGRLITPLVGRDEELRLVENRWDRTRPGKGSYC